MKIEFIFDACETSDDFTALRIAEALEKELLSDVLEDVVDFLNVLVEQKKKWRERQQ